MLLSEVKDTAQVVCLHTIMWLCIKSIVDMEFARLDSIIAFANWSILTEDRIMQSALTEKTVVRHSTHVFGAHPNSVFEGDWCKQLESSCHRSAKSQQSRWVLLHACMVKARLTI